MAPANLPSAFDATSQDIEMLLAAQCHIGSKNLQVHMNPYLWKTRADGVNVLNIGKTWYVRPQRRHVERALPLPISIARGDSFFFCSRIFG